MKNTLYFKTEEEKNQYFPDGVPSNILAVVGEEGVLYTSSNNRTMTGVSENQGGYNTSPDDEARITYLEENKADKSELVGLATEAYVTSAISGVSVDLTGYATEAYVTSKIQDVVGAAPAALDTLNELAVALNNDENFASYVATELAKKADSTDVPSLEGYATEAYVMGKGFLTEHQSLSDYATKAYVATYVATYGGGAAPDLSAYATKWALIGNQGTAFYENNNTYITSDSSYVLFSNKNTHAYYPNGKINFTGEEFIRYCRPLTIANPHSIDSINKDLVLSSDSSSNLGSYPHKQILISQTGYVYVSGIGGATDSNINNNSVTSYMSLQSVINDIQTNLGTAASVAELILGE